MNKNMSKRKKIIDLINTECINASNVHATNMVQY